MPVGLSPTPARVDTVDMWLWIGLVWMALALAGVLLHHRVRSTEPSYPPEVGSFMLRLESELAVAHPGVDFLGMLPDRFACLLAIDGQETPVSLHEAFRHAEAFPDAFAQVVNQLVEDIREVGLERAGDLDFGDAFQLLMPQVRSRDWLRQHGTFGDSGLVHTALNEELVTVYVLDDDSSMLFVCRAHLKQWGKSVADLHHIALGNLESLGSEGLADAAAEAVLLQSGDGFDASRVLLLQDQDGLLVSVPDRDVLWAAPEQGQDVEALIDKTADLAERATHPVSEKLFRITGGQLQTVQAQE